MLPVRQFRVVINPPVSALCPSSTVDSSSTSGTAHHALLFQDYQSSEREYGGFQTHLDAEAQKMYTPLVDTIKQPGLRGVFLERKIFWRVCDRSKGILGHIDGRVHNKLFALVVDLHFSANTSPAKACDTCSPAPRLSVALRWHSVCWLCAELQAYERAEPSPFA